jgi:hypothetical protein
VIDQNVKNIAAYEQMWAHEVATDTDALALIQKFGDRPDIEALMWLNACKSSQRNMTSTRSPISGRLSHAPELPWRGNDSARPYARSSTGWLRLTMRIQVSDRSAGAGGLGGWSMRLQIDAASSALK